MIDNQSEYTGSDDEIHSYISSDEMVSSSTDDVAPLPIITLPDDVQAYADIMKEKYQRQPIIATDWPPRVGRDFFGRLALVEKHNFVSQIETSWYMLRGEIDKIPRVYGNKNITVEDILKPRKGSESLRVVIDGPPGIGKTTLCRKLLNMWSNGEHKHYGLVLYCPLRSKKIAEAKILSDLLMYQTIKMNSITEWLEDNEGKGLLIFFDGWDELSEQHRKSSLVSSIICGDKLHHCSIIITSRSYASSSLLEKTSIVTKHIQVIGFSEEQISEVIRETFGTDPRDSQLAEKLIEDLEVRGDVRSLCYIPLVCSMVILVYRKEGGRLPTTLTQLYENFILQTIRRHVKRHDIDPRTLSSLSSLPPHLANALQEMCQIAYTNLANTRMTFYINKSASEAVKEDYLGLMTMFMEFDEEMHQFLHLSIQEFLAAWWIFKYQEKTAEEVFKIHFDDDHFRMCLRFVAGLTHLGHESYQQYFNKQLDLQCKREPLFGFGDYSKSLFLEHPAINIIIQHDVDEEQYDGLPDYIFDWSDPFPILLLQLLYESQNVALCQILAQSMISHSLHLTDKTFLSLFDWLCLSYFINNSSSSLNEINLGELDHQKSAVFTDGLTNGLQCRRLVMALPCESVHRLLHLSNMQELYLGSKFNANISLLFKLPQLKILHIGHLFKTDKQTALELEECIAISSTLQELKIETHELVAGDDKDYLPGTILTITSIIRGLARNKSITSFTVLLCHSEPPVPNGVIEQLLKDNNTLQALSIIAHDDKLLPSSLNIVEVNTPLTALEIRSSKLMTSLLPHLKGLHCLILPEPHPPRLLFDAHPSLHTLSLPLDTAESAIELFTILQTNTTLKALRVNIKEGTVLPCNCLKEFLTANQTIECLEVLEYKYPYASLLSANDVQYNTSLRSVTITLFTSEEITSALNVLSQKKNITEMYFHLKTETLFDEPFLPAVTNMLQSHTTIKILKIRAFLKSSNCEANRTEKLQKLYETIFIHPSLEYILANGFQSVRNVFKSHKEVLLERHKQEQPHRPLPTINLIGYY